MACGGGMNAYNLKQHFAVTGIDLSQPMLDIAVRQNPECTFLLADMRTCALGQEFDSIYVDDGIVHMNSRADLTALFHTAYRHLRPGGVMVVEPDNTKDTFRQNLTRVSELKSPEKPDNVDVAIIENYYDPDPTDETYEGILIFMIREDGELRIETAPSVEGLFTLATWQSLLAEAGFEVYEEYHPEQRHHLPVFACVKPL